MFVDLKTKLDNLWTRFKAWNSVKENNNIRVQLKCLIVLTLMATTIPASATTICQKYEFAELQTFSREELRAKDKEFGIKINKLLDGMVKAGRLDNNTATEINNCNEQRERVGRILMSEKMLRGY